MANTLYRKFYSLLKQIYYTVGDPVKKLFSRSIPIDDKVVLFVAFQGSYTCNPKAIADECIRRKLPYELYWTVLRNQPEEEYPPELKTVVWGSLDFFRIAARAKVIVDNAHDLARMGVYKKRGQYLLQTWHGSLGIKRLDGAIVMGKNWHRLAEKAQRDTDFCITNSTFEEEVFQSSYWKDVPVLRYGHARNDILFEKDPDILKQNREHICRSLSIDSEARLALYAPTHFDNDSIMPFSLDYQNVRAALEKRFGGRWNILVRLHKKQRSLSSKMGIEQEAGVVDATFYPDIQELMLAVDFALTDYSSWIFDYVLLRRPGAIIAAELEDFMQRRDFYYPLEETPFPIAKSNDELIKNIETFDEDVYKQRTEAFLKRLGCMEDGKASVRIADKLVALMEEGDI